MTGKFYINNSKTKWIVLNDGLKELINFKDGDKTITRTILYYEQFGDKVYIAFSYFGNIQTVPQGTDDITGMFD